MTASTRERHLEIRRLRRELKLQREMWRREREIATDLRADLHLAAERQRRTEQQRSRLLKLLVAAQAQGHGIALVVQQPADEQGEREAIGFRTRERKEIQ